MKSRKLIIGLIWLLILSCIQTSFSQDKEADKTKTGSEQCGSIIEGRRFCVTSAFISAKLDESIPFRVTIQNLTQEIINPGRLIFYDEFVVNITDSNGNRIIPIREILAEKWKNKTISNEEIGQLFPIFGGQLALIEPKQKLKIEYNLGYFYKFESKEKYFMKIARKISDKEIFTVEIEIK